MMEVSINTSKHLKGAILMNTIIHEVMKKITKDYTNSIDKLIGEKTDISKFILEMKKSLDEVGTELVGRAIEIVDGVVRDSKSRKKEYYIQRRDDEKTILTVFGEVKYRRTYYKNKKDGSYAYLSDDMVGIEPYARMDLSLEAALVEKSLDLSYQKSGEKISTNSSVSKQTVMNSIRKLGDVENSAVKIDKVKRVVDIIYIDADEDHVAMQQGNNKQIKLIYVHEGRKEVSKGRYELINKRYFTGSLNNNEELWLEVANYLEEAYEMDKVKKIYLSGDGAKWIKEGLNWIKDSQYVLDGFHLAKYVRKATAHMPECYHEVIWNYIDNQDEKSVKEVLDLIIEETEKETKKEAVKKSKQYILGNWEGIKRRYAEDYIGCSAEGHISHILSSRLSSRPLGWSLTGADQMARLRVYRANGGNIYELMSQKKEEEKKEKRIFKLDQRVVKRKLKTSINETLDNIPLINDGRRTWGKQYLKALRGA